jgi:2'-5' RNA ligase
MRAFLCIELGKEANEELTRAIEELKKSKLIIGKYVESKNLHLTLKFFGEISDDDVTNIKNKLETLKFRKFDAELEQVGYFSEDFIRVLWAGIKCAEIKGLVGKIEELFGRNDKNSGHITIARIKKISDKNKFKEFIKGLKIKKVKFHVDKISLKQSVLTEKGPIYSDVFIKKLE